MDTRKATTADCRAIAELALMAGEGIPAYFWERSRRAGQDILDVGALRLYQRLGYRVVEQRDVVEHPCHPYTGRVLLLTRDVHVD